MEAAIHITCKYKADNGVPYNYTSSLVQYKAPEEEELPSLQLEKLTDDVTVYSTYVNCLYIYPQNINALPKHISKSKAVSINVYVLLDETTDYVKQAQKV